ncbi:hypothetical protein SMCM5_45580 [Serratia marcescens]|nr:hypothetical protein SMCM5_45580 [Serratia marcescens]CUZ83480.1 Uncharacterised protein [Serratia marcescens]CVE59600.1 Uncharacterised protein [Serratia marcescens]
MSNENLNIRQQFASAAMQALVISGLNTGAWADYVDMAKSAYRIADEMLDADLLTNCAEIKLHSAKLPYIRTHSGHHFYYQVISPDAIDIDDIAQALSNICRFAGHLDDFYSVAQHSVLVSRLVPPELALEALLHDASEAYCQDIPAPLKALLPDYRDIEASVDNAIRSLFGLPMEHSPEVKRADLVMLATERRDLGIDDGDKWDILDGIAPTDEFAIHPLNPRQARQLFIARFNELWRVRVEQRRQEIFGDTTP